MKVTILEGTVEEIQDYLGKHQTPVVRDQEAGAWRRPMLPSGAVNLDLYEPDPQKVKAWADARIGRTLQVTEKLGGTHDCKIVSWSESRTGIYLFCEHDAKAHRQWALKVMRRKAQEGAA